VLLAVHELNKLITDNNVTRTIREEHYIMLYSLNVTLYVWLLLCRICRGTINNLALTLTAILWLLSLDYVVPSVSSHTHLGQITLFSCNFRNRPTKCIILARKPHLVCLLHPY